MAYALIASAKSNPGGQNTSTTDAINSTGANLIVVGISWYSATTADTVLSDSNLNTWSPLTVSHNTAADLKARLFYSFNPTVGAGHTFTSAGVSTYAAIFVQAFSGAASSPFDQENGANTNGTPATSQNSGSVTPSENNEVLVSVVSAYDNSTPPTTFIIGSSFNATDTEDYDPGFNLGGGLAYKIQTSAGAENPTWSWTNNSEAAVAIATFKAAASVAAGSFPLLPILGVGQIN